MLDSDSSQRLWVCWILTQDKGCGCAGFWLKSKAVGVLDSDSSQRLWVCWILTRFGVVIFCPYSQTELWIVHLRAELWGWFEYSDNFNKDPTPDLVGTKRA